MEFKFNDEIDSPAKFHAVVKPDCEKKQTPCMILCEDLTLRFCLLFWHDVSSVTISFGKL